MGYASIHHLQQVLFSDHLFKPNSARNVDNLEHAKGLFVRLEILLLYHVELSLLDLIIWVFNI
jgi:hypothetical protein